MILLLGIFPWVFSLIGFLLVASSFFWARALWVYFLVLAAAIVLHGLSAEIISQPLGIEPSHQRFYDAHDLAIFYFWDGLPFFVVPLLVKLLYVYICSCKKSA